MVRLVYNGEHETAEDVKLGGWENTKKQSYSIRSRIICKIIIYIIKKKSL